ncbi:MAG TPA: N-6 DNA methylase [Thermoanaerobaculia bacterium]|jgi:adenine-specific DNA methylase|nr:N-6 DNA methylase [Thermoanaerobaculia bacterium]
MLAEMVTSTPVERDRRKSLGAFYSPQALVGPMVAWAVTRADQSVLDPSCGDGVFLETAARRLRGLGAGPEQAASLLHAVDLNPDAVRVTRNRLISELGRPFGNARVASFFSLPPPGALFGPPEGVDVVVGNPPYIRYQDFAGGARLEALERAADAGVQLTRLASSWAHFVVHAVEFLRPGGRLALILPAELIHTSYAAPLRQHLRRSFAEVHVVSFRRSVFPGVQAEVVLLLTAGKERGPARLALTEVETGSDLADLAAVLAGAEVFAPGEEPEKWLPGYAAHPGAVSLDRLQDRGLLEPLGQIGKASIGFVSGANEYFVLTPEESALWRLPESSLRPALIRARLIPGPQLTAADMAAFRSQGERCLLWTPGERLTRAEQTYVRRGEDLGYDGRYKCRVRSPWFRVPGVITPDAFLTYMSDVVPRLCLNRARVVASNNLLTVRLPRIPAALQRAFVIAFYNSATLLSCERVGRSYGGGVLKLEPREADRILVPAADLIARHKGALLKAAAQVDTAIRNGREGCLDEALATVDAILFEDEGVARGEMAAARASLHERRRARARPARGKGSRVVSISSRRGP